MSDELDRLKADLEVLERYHGYSILENAREDLANKIDRLEADEADPWRDIKEKIDSFRSRTDEPTVRLIAYIDYLTAREQELAHGLACMVSTYGKSGNDSEIAVNHARKLIDCEGEEIDVSFEIESAEAADPWRKAKETFDRWRNFSVEAVIKDQVVPYVDHLTAENARLTARVAELEAEAKAEDDEDIHDAEEALANMIPPYEGLIESIEPILNPARVLATAAKWIDGEFRGRSSTSRSQDAIDFLLRNGGNLSQPYPMKGGEE